MRPHERPIKEREFRFARALFLVSCSCSILLSAILMIRHRESLLLPLTLLVLLPTIAWCAFHQESRNRRWIRFFFALAAINTFLLVPELALRIAGFQYVSGIQMGLRFTYFVNYEPDPRLFWILPRSLPNVNSMGMKGREPITPKPGNTYRILFLGDSCTYQGYAAFVAQHLKAKAQLTKTIECVLLALPGYTSHQGRVLAKMYGQKLDPDLVFVYFGWNDHWLAFGSPDARQTVYPFPEKVYRNTRTLQAIQRIITTWGLIPDKPLRQVRVSVDDYRKNLMDILEVFRRSSIPVIFITAPTSHYQLGAPSYLVALKYARDKDSVTVLHREYNQVVRDISKSEGAFLIDLEKRFEYTSNPRRLFNEDGIHFTQPEGLKTVATVLGEFVTANLLQ